ncbi:MAG: hypothetical protein NTV34_06595, partial [Proteobacteria bacterium]|nr:hypothetical protein [Pseudomonadota bacterium]
HMGIKFTQSLILSVAFSSTAFANVFDLTSVKDAIQKHQNKNLKVDQHVDASCTNFTGTWKGTCTDTSGKKKEDTTVIRQYGCGVISLSDSDTLPLFFGGVNNEGYTIKTSAISYTTTIDWNKEQTVANIAMHGLGRALGGANFWEMTGNGNLYLVDENNLKVRFGYQSTSTADGEIFRSGASQSCQYLKQN